MKDKEIKIEKMVLNLEGEKISLTLEQARKLRDVLDELFKKEIVKEVIHEHHHDWWYRPCIQPAIYNIDQPAITSPQIYCSSNTLEITC